LARRIVFGLALMALSVGLIVLGLLRDDGKTVDANIEQLSPRERMRRRTA
jgi:hypothetical protein